MVQALKHDAIRGRLNDRRPSQAGRPRRNQQPGQSGAIADSRVSRRSGCLIVAAHTDSTGGAVYRRYRPRGGMSATVAGWGNDGFYRGAWENEMLEVALVEFWQFLLLAGLIGCVLVIVSVR